MKYLSLFSGVEAATVAWQPLGWECVGVAEIEPFPCAVLKHHYPNTPNLGDISKITKEQIMALGHIDIVVGGFPCQDVSVAGLRKGLEDAEGNRTRSGLFFDAMRIVRWCREFNGTRFLLIENVPGLLSSKLGADFASVLGEMVGSAISPPKDKWKNSGVVIGPDGMCEWCVLDAQYFGVPQRRRRVFALADFGNWISRPPILLEPESLSGNPPPSRETGKEVARSAGKSTARGSHWDGTGVHPSLNQCHNIGGVGMSNQEISAQRGAYLVDAKNEAYCLQGNMIGRKEENRPQGDGVNKEISFTLNTLDRHGIARVHIPDCGGGSETLLCSGIPDVCGALTDGAHNGGGLNGQDAYTGRILPVINAVRRLTPTECERLQGFPDDYTNIPWRGKETAPDGPRYKAIGNSMAVPVMRWIGERINFIDFLYGE